METLMPCPFCGGNAEIQESLLCFRIACKSCKDDIGDNIQSCSCTEYFEKDKLNEAISAWNRRYTGMSDIHGVKIFKGDKIRETNFLCVEVTFCNGCFGAICNVNQTTAFIPLFELKNIRVLR